MLFQMTVFILFLFAIAINICVYVGDYFLYLVYISSSAMIQRYYRLLEVLTFFCLLFPFSVFAIVKAAPVFWTTK